MVAVKPDFPSSNARALRRWAGGSGARRQPIWFGALVAIGILLGALVLVRAYVSYRYVSNEFLTGYLIREAGTLVVQLESISRQESRTTPDSLQPVLQELHNGNAGRVAWIAVCADSGTAAAQAGPAVGSCAAEDVKRVLELRAPAAEPRDGSDGRLLVVTIPYGLRQDPGRATGAGLNVAQVALFIDKAGGPLAPLRRSLALTVTAALALMASMVTAALWFPSFLRGRQLAQQMRLARDVQRLLLPAAFPAGSEVDIAATCVPAWDVGGDYYDVFRAPGGDVVLVVADVAGKGVAAGLLTALVHGAVHAVSLTDVSEPGRLIRDINDLLYGRSAENRYATMFWARLNPRDRSLQYVNAGHLPPVVVSHHTANGWTVQRLDVGGPVVGLLPGVSYEAATIQLHQGDVLVAYSDGLTEAENAQGEEFGDIRLISTLEKARHESAAEILQRILSAVGQFVERRPFGDDLTLLVVRIP
jgi:serine phosphatase RsbU (regulator of sigma subunit)